MKLLFRQSRKRNRMSTTDIEPTEGTTVLYAKKLAKRSKSTARYLNEVISTLKMKFTRIEALSSLIKGIMAELSRARNLSLKKPQRLFPLFHFFYLSYAILALS